MSSQLKNLSDFSETEVPSAAPFHFGIVVAEWNPAITNALYQGAYESLIEHGALPENIYNYSVPGSLGSLASIRPFQGSVSTRNIGVFCLFDSCIAVLSRLLQLL